MNNIMNHFANGYISTINANNNNNDSTNDVNQDEIDDLSDDLHHDMANMDNDLNDILLLNNNLFTSTNNNNNNDNTNSHNINNMDTFSNMGNANMKTTTTTPNILHSPSVLDNLISPLNNNLSNNNIDQSNNKNITRSNTNSPGLHSFINMNSKIEKSHGNTNSLQNNSLIRMNNEKENVNIVNNDNNTEDNGLSNVIDLEKDFNNLINKNIQFGKNSNNNSDSNIDAKYIHAVNEQLSNDVIDPQNYLSIPSQDLKFDLYVNNLPQITRVENQLKLNLIWQPNLWDKFIVHLPTNAIIKEKFYLTQSWSQFPDSFKKHLILLETFVLDANNLRNIPVCSKCVNREKRRASRRKSGMNDNVIWCMDPNRNAMIFNNKQLVSIKHTEVGDSIELNTRIICYCRHHKSDDGFKLLFVLKDANDNVIARTLTDPIQITDKKLINSNGSIMSLKKDSISSISSINTNSKSRNNSAQVPILSGNNDDNNNYSLNIQNNTTSNNNDNDEDDTGITNNLNDNFLIPISENFLINNNGNDHNNDTNGHHNLIHHDASPNDILNLRKHIPSPTSLDDISESLTHSLLNGRRINNNHNRNNTLPVINNQLNTQFNNNTAHDNIAQNSNKRTRRQMSTVHHPSQFNLSNNNTITNSNNATNNATNNNNTSNNNDDKIPTIQRVIPSKGPINGGIEVTLLGANFKQGLVVKFGNNVALSSQCWSESTILTYLPPATVAGQVFVTITENEIDLDNDENAIQLILPQQRSIFTYVDETDRQLIELALQIVGLKMNGKLEDAKNIAKRIVDDDTKNSPSPNSNNNNYSTNLNNINTNTSSFSPITDSDEDLIIKVIKRLNKTTSNLNMCDPQGRTLLHLASLKGYIHLVTVLVKSGCNIDYKDTFGYTALHFAAIAGNYKILQLLIVCQAKINTMNCNNLTPKDLYLINHRDNINDKIVDLLIDTESNSDLESIDTSEVESIDNEFSNFNNFDLKNDTNNQIEMEMPHILRKLSQISLTSSILDENDSMEPINLLSSRPSFSNLNNSYNNISRMNNRHDKNNSTNNFYNYSNNENNEYITVGYNYNRDDGYENSSEYDSRDEVFNDRQIFFNHNDDSIDEIATNDYTNNTTHVSTEEDNNDTGDGNDDDETNHTDSSNNLSLWNRMINKATEELPKYDDLFPKLKSNLNKGKQIIINQTNTLANTINHDDNISFNRTHSNSSEDEYDMIQKKLNPFLQNKLDFHKDKMLLFFWLPLMILILTCMIWMHFNQNDNNFVIKLNTMFKYYIGVGLGKFYLGNERMKTVFRDGISNLQTSGILNDLIVS